MLTRISGPWEASEKTPKGCYAPSHWSQNALLKTLFSPVLNTLCAHPKKRQQEPAAIASGPASFWSDHIFAIAQESIRGKRRRFDAEADMLLRLVCAWGPFYVRRRQKVGWCGSYPWTDIIESREKCRFIGFYCRRQRRHMKWQWSVTAVWL